MDVLRSKERDHVQLLRILFLFEAAHQFMFSGTYCWETNITDALLEIARLEVLESAVKLN